MITLLVHILILCLIAGCVLWCIRFIGLPDPINKIATVVVVIIILIALIYLLKGSPIL